MDRAAAQTGRNVRNSGPPTARPHNWDTSSTRRTPLQLLYPAERIRLENLPGRRTPIRGGPCGVSAPRTIAIERAGIESFPATMRFGATHVKIAQTVLDQCIS